MMSKQVQGQVQQGSKIFNVMSHYNLFASQFPCPPGGRPVVPVALPPNKGCSGRAPASTSRAGYADRWADENPSSGGERNLHSVFECVTIQVSIGFSWLCGFSNQHCTGKSMLFQLARRPPTAGSSRKTPIQCQSPVIESGHTSSSDRCGCAPAQSTAPRSSALDSPAGSGGSRAGAGQGQGFGDGGAGSASRRLKP